MAGGRPVLVVGRVNVGEVAAMEPRPDGRGKEEPTHDYPQRCTVRRNGAPA